MQFVKTLKDSLMKPTILPVLLTCSALVPSATLADWAGPYVGLSAGTAVDATVEVESGGVSAGRSDFEDFAPFGVFAGYQVQSGQLVFGGELAFSRASDVSTPDIPDSGSGDIDMTDLKGRVGYDLGTAMIYGVLGLSSVTPEDSDDSADGFNIGFGADYAVAPNFVISAEYLARRTDIEFSDTDTEFQIDIDTITVRAAYKF